MTSLPVCADLAWWCTAWLRGFAGSDDLLARFDLSPALLARVRGTGSSGAAVALPSAGDPLGLSGPAEFNLAALEAGGAVLVGDVGLVPHEGGWRLHHASPRTAPDLGEVDRGLRSAVLTGLDRLADRSMLTRSPDLADALLDLTRPRVLDVPPGTPPVAVDLAGRAVPLLAACRLARSVGVAGDPERAAALGALDAAARRAVVGACSADAWPPVASDAP